jgi:hypothetical protein
MQLEQALEVSEKDVKDASAGVLQDLRRFQKDKEADLRRYMVCYSDPPAGPIANNGWLRSHTPAVIWIGHGRISRRGPRPKTKWIRSWHGRVDC